MSYFSNPTWLKTFSLKALELYTFILTWPLQKSIHDTMIPTAFGYTTKLFYWLIAMKFTNIIHSSVKISTYNYSLFHFFDLLIVLTEIYKHFLTYYWHLLTLTDTKNFILSLNSMNLSKWPHFFLLKAKPISARILRALTQKLDS